MPALSIQPGGPVWPGDRTCAVSLTYDDALPVHAQAAAELVAHGLRGTFYINLAADPSPSLDEWRSIALAGHELGNHTLFHPCRRDSRAGRWVNPAFDLGTYTPDRLRAELAMANKMLSFVDGQAKRSFACTCFNTRIGRFWNRTSIPDLVQSSFTAIRTIRTDRPNRIGPAFNLHDVGAVLADGLALGALQDLVAQARKCNGWLVLVAHGIGAGTAESFMPADVHTAFLAWLARQDDVWVAPVIGVAQHVTAAPCL